jgi:hypothetical protein
MAARRTNAFEQKLIDHEIRVSKVREAGELYAASREARRERRSGLSDRRWYRDQLISMLMAARTEADLEGLGLSDEVVREAGLGDSLHETWAGFHSPPDSPDRVTGARGSGRTPPVMPAA